MGSQLSPRIGAEHPNFSSHVYCGQTVAHLSSCWALVSRLLETACSPEKPSVFFFINLIAYQNFILQWHSKQTAPFRMWNDPLIHWGLHHAIKNDLHCIDVKTFYVFINVFYVFSFFIFCNVFTALCTSDISETKQSSVTTKCQCIQKLGYDLSIGDKYGKGQIPLRYTAR